MHTDDELVTSVLSTDDQRAFATLVTRHQSSVRHIMARLTRGDRDRADDLAQEAFIKAYQNLSKYRRGQKFRAWVTTIGYRLFLDMIRKEKRRQELMDEGLDIEDSVNPHSDSRIDLEGALNALPGNQRIALTLCFNHGYSHPEAADIMDIPIGTLKSHIDRGKKALKEILEPAHAEMVK